MKTEVIYPKNMNLKFNKQWINMNEKRKEIMPKIS